MNEDETFLVGPHGTPGFFLTWEECKHSRESEAGSLVAAKWATAGGDGFIQAVPV